jgi:hypothetical protein
MAGIGRRMARLKLHLRRICSRRLTTYFSPISFRSKPIAFSAWHAVGADQFERIGHVRPAEPRSVGARGTVTRWPVPFTLNR